MSLYSRARKHIDMKRVKEIREEKIKEQKISKSQKAVSLEPRGDCCRIKRD